MNYCELFGNHLRPLQNNLGPSRNHLGSVWSYMGLIGNQAGPLRSYSKKILGSFWTILNYLGPFLPI